MRPRYWWIPVCSSVGVLAACGGFSRNSLSEPRQLDLLPREGRAVERGAMLLESSFAQQQLRYSRVRAARLATHSRIVRLFDDRNIAYPAAEVFLRVFKDPGVLEVWVRPEGQREMKLLKSYDICAQSGVRGPKRWRGDQQVPEGFYFINEFNATSSFHLSLGIDYPNRHDRAANRGGRDLGGDIFIHGGCASVGCLALRDEAIQELYWIAVEARAAGQQRIPVHIFPTKLDDRGMRRLDAANANHPLLVDFWKSLKPGYDFFEEQRRVPRVGVDSRGRYSLEKDQGGEKRRHLASTKRTPAAGSGDVEATSTRPATTGRSSTQAGSARSAAAGSAPQTP